MFQSFDVTSTPQYGSERTQALRASFDTLGIDGFLVPRADEYQGEYVPASAERLSWLTGFTGSAGVALVTRNQAVVFVDGRYVTQLAEQVDGSVFTGGDLVGEPPHLWLQNHAPKGFRLGIDPWLHTGADVRRLEKVLGGIGGTLVFLPHNPLDRAWTDRPAEPLGRVTIQAIENAGELARDKLSKMAEETGKAGADALVVTDPSSIAWIFNIRGSDVPHTPLALGFAPARARHYPGKRPSAAFPRQAQDRYRTGSLSHPACRPPAARSVRRRGRGARGARQAHPDRPGPCSLRSRGDRARQGRHAGGSGRSRPPAPRLQE